MTQTSEKNGRLGVVHADRNLTGIASFGAPFEVRKFKKGRLELVKIAGATIGRVILEAGWRWSKHVKPIVKTKSCLARHLFYEVSGILKIRFEDGKEMECHPGDIAYVPIGHDAWVVGDEPVVAVDFLGMLDYAHVPIVNPKNRLSAFDYAT